MVLVKCCYFFITKSVNNYYCCLGYLPPPIHPSQLTARLLQQQKYDKLQVSLLLGQH